MLQSKKAKPRTQEQGNIDAHDTIQEHEKRQTKKNVYLSQHTGTKKRIQVPKNAYMHPKHLNLIRNLSQLEPWALYPLHVQCTSHSHLPQVVVLGTGHADVQGSQDEHCMPG
jgi:hypothetical protein